MAAAVGSGALDQNPSTIRASYLRGLAEPIVSARGGLIEPQLDGFALHPQGGTPGTEIRFAVHEDRVDVRAGWTIRFAISWLDSRDDQDYLEVVGAYVEGNWEEIFGETEGFLHPVSWRLGVRTGTWHAPNASPLPDFAVTLKRVGLRWLPNQ